MKKVDAIIFDMDGVLIDTERISFKSFQEVFENYNYEIDEKFYLTMIGRNTKGIKVLMEEKFGKEFPFDEIYKQKVKLSRDTIDKDGVIIKKGVHDIIDYLNEKNYKIAVATSTSRQRALNLLEEIGIKEKVNYIICGDQVKNSKPDPEIFLKAAKGLNVNPKNCIVIEDSDAGIIASHAAKMIGIHVPDMKSLENDTKKFAFKICENLFEVKKYLEEIKEN